MQLCCASSLSQGCTQRIGVGRPPKPLVVRADASKKDKKKKANGVVQKGLSKGPPLQVLDGGTIFGTEYITNVEELDELEAEGARFMDAVVKVYCVHTEPNYSLPWQRKRQYGSTSTGFMVQGPKGERWLLTNAHAVEHYSQVKVKRRGDDQKFIAEVLSVGTDCDIALLSVADDDFWKGVEALRFGPLPRLQDAVAVVGYPIGGDTISVTSGVVSRIEVTAYVHASTELLGIQIDAAINSGNSGGPVFNSMGECVGIAFQSMAGGEAENIGYVIPTPVINHFLNDYMRNGKFTGFPVLGVNFQLMESNALKRAYGLTGDRKGVLVRFVAPTFPAAGVLRPGDIIMRFDGVPVASDGTVPFRTGERIAFGYLISQKYTGEHAELLVLREGKEVVLDVTLSCPTPLVPLHLRGADPSYLIVAGLVFTACCAPYLESEYGGDYMSDSPVRLLDAMLHGYQEYEGQQVVILSQVLACDATLGYEELYNIRLKKFNDVAVKNLRHLVELVQDCKDTFMRYDLDYEQVVVIDRESAEAATQEVLKAHSIPSAVSKDLQVLLPAAAEEASAVLDAALPMRQKVLAPTGGTSGVASPRGEVVRPPVAEEGVVAGSPTLLQKPTSDLIGTGAASP
eukprot:jgi/Botrbrau1/10758/Bobra.180_2s0023.1